MEEFCFLFLHHVPIKNGRLWLVGDEGIRRKAIIVAGIEVVIERGMSKTTRDEVDI